MIREWWRGWMSVETARQEEPVKLRVIKHLTTDLRRLIEARRYERRVENSKAGDARETAMV